MTYVPNESFEMFFRCAQTGQRFHVALGRQLPTHRFRVLKVVAETPDSLVGMPDKIYTATHAAREAQSFDASEVDFSGWFCPCCGHWRETQENLSFVRCSTCNEYVCGGLIIQLPDGGPATFACHDGCGGGGRVGVHYLISYDGTPAKVADNRQVLPPAPSSSQLQGRLLKRE